MPPDELLVLRHDRVLRRLVWGELVAAGTEVDECLSTGYVAVVEAMVVRDRKEASR